MATWDDVASVVGELPLSEERSPREWRVGISTAIRLSWSDSLRLTRWASVS
jgi:hypothetical protein